MFWKKKEFLKIFTWFCWNCFAGLRKLYWGRKSFRRNFTILDLNPYKSRFVNFEVPQGVQEVESDNVSIIDLVKVNAVSDDVEIRTKIVAANKLRFDEKSVCKFLICLKPISNNMPSKLLFSQKSIDSSPIDEFWLKFDCVNHLILYRIREPVLFPLL